MVKAYGRSVEPADIYANNVRRTPISHARSVRPDDISSVTTGFAGKFQPLAMVPLLREDGVMSSRLTVNFQMAETTNLLLNPVRATAVAYLVPKLAFDRYPDQGTIDRSYNGQQEIDGSVVPWFEARNAQASTDLQKSLGIHRMTNTDYVEAYNQVWNFIAKQRSPDLALRDRLDETIAPAFWEHNQMKHVKASFDDAMIEGEVPLTVTDAQISTVPGQELLLPLEYQGSANVTATAASMRADGQEFVIHDSGDANRMRFYREQAGSGNTRLTASLDGVMSELSENGVVVSLANINLARETAAWARLRTQFQGLDEDWMMDQLLAGIRMPYEALKHPILLDHQDTIFGMQQRYATDSANLDKSATEGQTSVTLNLNVPQLSTGGVIVICAQSLPEQIFERQRDYYATASKVDDLPNRTADELDPQPVSLVSNVEVDEKHSLGGDLFGYAPLNHQWQRNSPRLGGRYWRENPDDAWTEDRNRIWDTSVVDPQLGTDFYTATQINQDVFADTQAENFEYWVGGRVNISGLTYFGPALRESQGDYDKVLSQVDQDRVKGDGTDVPT
jgi:hypothetical protein